MYTDPFCLVRCNLEKRLSCETGFNGCSVHQTSPNYYILERAIRYSYRRGVLSGSDQCASLAGLGGTSLSLLNKVRPFLEGPFSIFIELGVHFSKCACYSAKISEDVLKQDPELSDDIDLWAPHSGDYDGDGGWINL